MKILGAGPARWFLFLFPLFLAFAASGQTTVGIVAVDSASTETVGNPGAFQLTRSDTNGTVVAEYAITGTASNGIDYATIPSSVMFHPGISNLLINIQPLEDTVPEPVENVVLTLRTNYFYILSTNSKATVTIGDNDNQFPSISIISPSSNSVIAGPTNIIIRAGATDADGWIKRVEFWKNQSLLGSVPGNEHTNLYTFIWSNAPPGSYSIQARAIDNFEAARYSAPVSFTITGPPFVSVSAIDGTAAETAPGTTNTGTFKISRNTGTNHALTVLFSLSGTASNRIDYTHIGDAVTIPAGALFTNVIVRPVNDTIVESVETVVLSLRTNSAYLLGEVRSATVSIQDNDVNVSNTPPVVHLVKPLKGTSFVAPTNILLTAEARDTNGWIQSVSFFSNGDLLGTVTNYNSGSVAPSNLFHFVWTNVPPGEYSIAAKAVDNGNAMGTSEPVLIFVREPEVERTVITVTATDPEASEIGVATVIDPAVFTFHRTGNTNIPITIYFSIGGTAQNGEDYVRISNSIPLAAGHTSTNLRIWPFNDTIVEGKETVVITVAEPACIAIYPPPPECYLAGTGRTATAYIIDDDVQNVPPTVELVSPTNNAVFHGPLNLPLHAHAADSDGHVAHVDFFRGDLFLGRDSSAPYSMIWSNAMPGTYQLTAKATDNQGATRISEPRKITILSATQSSFVFRKLPMWYVPGVKLLVQLRCEPKTNTVAYSALDRPPTNWVVGAISHDGVLDAEGRVHFGPFNDGQARTLTYEVTPPPYERGEKRFVGSGIANNLPTPINGAQWIVHAPAHPADRNPTNFVMTLEEVHSYAESWRRCKVWPISPNPIPVNYVSRAGYLWKMGGGYKHSTAVPAPMPPLLWISTNTPVVTAENSPELIWSTNRFGTAVSTMPTNYSVGVPFTVSIAVAPAAGVLVYAVEERVPFGWTVTNISHEGVFCPMTARVRWGVFLNSTNRTLSYRVTPASNNAPNVAEFAGVVSFDGMNVPVTGNRRAHRGTTIGPARLESIQTMADGNRLLTFQGEPGFPYTLEGSTNLIDWTRMEVLLNNDGVLHYIDVEADPVQRFYRAVQQE